MNPLDPSLIIPGGGEMGRLVREKDWAQTPLGPIASWPQSLRTTVNLCLASNFPISIAWGPRRVQIYNDGYWPICGAKHPQSLGQDFSECWSAPWPVIGEAFEQASRGKTAFLENRRMFLDRNGYLEETFFTFSFSPVRDESGGVGGLFHPVTELTQQTIAERRLQVLRDVADQTADGRSVEEAARILAHTFESSTLDLPFVLLYLVDQDGREATLVQNTGLPKAAPMAPARIDLQLSSLPGWPFHEAVFSGHAVEVNDVFKCVGEFNCGPYPEPPRSAFVIPVFVPGHNLPLALVVAGVSARRPLNPAHRTFYEMLSLAMTNAFSKAHAWEEERKRAEALAELDRAKTAFFSNVSHEFRTPLTLLLGPLEDELRENAAARPRLELVHRNALRLLKLVNTLLHFSRLEAGRMQATYQPIDISAFTAELASVFRSAIEKAGLRLIVDCPPLPEPLYVDCDMWEKIVLNLLSNALKFTFEGEIRVAIHEAGDRVELLVSDTGTGIPAAELPHIFERFHRIREARSRSHEGTGIGLALVDELVRLHGGEVTALSTEGRGTSFTVAMRTGSSHLSSESISAPRSHTSTSSGTAPYVEEALRWLPAVKQDSSPAAGEGSDPSLVPANLLANKFRVLLADDNADMREYLRRLLGKRYEVLAVADGEAALTALRQDQVDLVITDVMMPRLDGFGLLHAMRTDPVLKSMPVILLSARAGEESRVEGLDAGADDYLVKPFSAQELLARVGSALNMARIRREAEVEVRKSEARLAAANRDLNEFATVVSHDLKAPLRGVATLANWLRSDYAGKLDQEGRENLAEMVRRVSRMDKLIDGILRYSRAGRPDELAFPVSLAELVPGVVEDLVPRDGFKHVRIDIAPQLPVVPGDPIRLRQVFQNLISNAIKFSDKSEIQINVGCEKFGDHWEFTISDNGRGIDQRHFERIFKLFETLSPKDKADSTGVGLAVVKRIVEGADGKVRVHSVPGQGSTFSFTWPCSSADHRRNPLVLADSSTGNDGAG